LTKLFAI